jgi:PAS domain S-box-containing protein
MSWPGRLAAPLRGWLTASIRRQLIVGVALVHAVLMTIFVFDLVNRQQGFMHQQNLEHARALAETLAANSVSWVLASDVSGLQEVVRAQAGYPHLEYAMVVDPDGKVLGHADEGKAGLYLSDAISRGMLTSTEGFVVLNDNLSLVDVAVPVLANGQRIAWARIGINQGVTLNELRHVTREGLIYTAAAILIGILFAILLSRGIIGGLNELFGVASRICSGERGDRVQLQRKDEIGDLGMAFNLMLDGIDEQERQKITSQQQLQQAEERIRLLLDSTAEGIIGFDADGRCTFANPAGMQILGYEQPGEIIGKSHLRLLCGDEGECSGCNLESFRTVLNDGRQVHCDETVLVRSNGSGFVAEYWLSPIRDEDRVIGAVLTFIDISVRKQVEQELQIYREDLEERVEARTAELTALNRELEAFSYSVSHDLRAPLRSIHGFSKILVSKYHDSLDDTGQDYLQRVMRASNRMGELIDDLLVLSRVSRSELNYESVDMNRLVRQVMQELREGDEGREPCFEVEPLPPARGDRKLLGVVLHNLLGNALKFTGKEEHPCIRVSAAEEGDEIVYTVSDNGVGFDMAYADKLFGAFQRLHSSDEFEGTGIGLATVQRILHRHGGSIWAEAETDGGAQFHFILSGARG